MEDGMQEDVDIIDGIMQRLARVFAIQDVEEAIDIDINFAYLSVLFQIHILEEPTMGELARVSEIQLSTLTRVIDRLVEREFVTRKNDPHDRRVVRVSLTAKGSQIMEKYEEARRKRVGLTLKQLSFGERKELVKILEKIQTKIFDGGKEGTNES
ncbi:MarR family transcriptional regulator [Candidatus Aerophobetes bacterium]|nr:MarR family transcriptional regulator [Candidatus Aerophobetes bacterium]